MLNIFICLLGHNFLLIRCVVLSWIFPCFREFAKQKFDSKKLDKVVKDSGKPPAWVEQLTQVSAWLKNHLRMTFSYSYETLIPVPRLYYFIAKSYEGFPHLYS